MSWPAASHVSRSVGITRRRMCVTRAGTGTPGFALAILLPRTALAEEPAAPRSAATFRLLTWNIQMLPTSVSFASESLRKKQHLRTPWIIELLKEADYDIV